MFLKGFGNGSDQQLISDMKELTKEFQESEVEIVAEKQQQKEIRLIGRQRKIRGLTLWEYRKPKNYSLHNSRNRTFK